MRSAFHAIYHVRADAEAIDRRARALAVEQSVEMPVEAIDDARVLAEIVGRVADIRALAPRRFEVRIALAAETVGKDPGQLLNMLFGNTSLHEDVVLHDAELPAELAAAWGGPRHGLHALRQRVGASGRALTCAALKPQGLPVEKLAALAQRLARGRIDYIKDDHGLADQDYSPFAARVAAIAATLRATARVTGRPTRYVPNIYGNLDAMRQQIEAARNVDIDAVLIAPMIVGLSDMLTLVRENPDIAFFAHPALAGAARISPQLLFGKIFRLVGADGVVFPNHGGRFGYSPDTCRDLAATALAPWHGLRPSVPIPAGGMTRERVPEMLDFYHADVMLLIGGALLRARDKLIEATADFVAAVESYRYG